MWKIKYHPQALKNLKKLDKSDTKRIVSYLEKISNNPKSSGKLLSASLSGLWRYRVGDYRIICDIEAEKLTVLVVKVGHRSKVYH